MSRPVVIAVDSSTTATKAVAVDASGHVVAEGRAPHHRRSPRPGWQEQDAPQWWSATAEALRQVTGVIEGRAVPQALCITHQRESFVCLDEQGEPVRPAVLWLDTRAGEQIARLGGDEVHSLSGKPASTTPSLYKLVWLAEHEPDVLKRTALVMDAHGYLVHKLTGEVVTSWASADPLSLLDMTTFSWSPRLLDLVGLSPDQLPRLAAPGSLVGTVTPDAAAATGLPAGLPVVAGAGDGQSAGLGAGVLSPGRAYLNLGTGLTLGVHSDSYAWSRAFRTLSSPVAGAYTLEALLSSGALSIAWFRDEISGLPRDGAEAVLEQLAADVPAGALGLLFMPYLTSAETPHWDAQARGAFVGLSDRHGRADMYRAVLEGLAYEERNVLARIEEATEVPVREVVALGGAARSPLFTQLLADVLERPVLLSDEVETTALGAAILAAAHVGLDGIADVADAVGRMSGASVVREPDPAHRSVYRAAAAAHSHLYPALREVFPMLSVLRGV